jgi:hypothetical protein
VVRPGDGGITRKIRAQAATASEPIRLPVSHGAADTCGGPAVFLPRRRSAIGAASGSSGRRFLCGSAAAWSGSPFKETATALEQVAF